ncbi:uncharacterized protein AB675_7727 [Cyphellophora attinorum]|uniref:Uncharacterized protein n=1 Tax=Cyphellophora attinorum TaxID=1664694 RepID=A0A0N1HR09_9EURO|nr:uncharacterized protein AB675_7727 [Phialophora attinorum]KPI40556.1 hypothetical protein AB675_7727 [Phialophora attinorum]
MPGSYGYNDGRAFVAGGAKKESGKKKVAKALLKGVGKVLGRGSDGHGHDGHGHHGDGGHGGDGGGLFGGHGGHGDGGGGGGGGDGGGGGAWIKELDWVYCDEVGSKDWKKGLWKGHPSWVPNSTVQRSSASSHVFAF